VSEGSASAQNHEVHFPKLKNPFAGDPKAIKEGRTIFLESGCAKCHADGATGGKGPNLTDGDWLISGEDGALFHTIQKGRKRKGQKEEMPSWEEALEPEDIWKVITWIRSISKGDGPKMVRGGASPATRRTGRSVPPPPMAWPKQK